MKSNVYKLAPAVKSYIWGGNYFQKFGKGNGEEIISELWELSTRDSSSVIVNGLHQGELLKDVITNEDIGPVSKRFPYFPLLIKLIDAKDNLSVQVHPSDDYALKNENSFGKTEMWHIISHDSVAHMYSSQSLIMFRAQTGAQSLRSCFRSEKTIPFNSNCF